jgi:hypothetical protein
MHDSANALIFEILLLKNNSFFGKFRLKITNRSLVKKNEEIKQFRLILLLFLQD